MYQDLRTSGQLSYDAVIGRFTDHQSKWPEAIFNEDMYVKCIEPLILDGDGCDKANASNGGTVTRVEAFLEMLN